MQHKPFFISIPHSGERLPKEVPWLQNLPETVQMCDVDRFVDFLYKPVIEQLKLPHVVTQWHRYFADLNRWPDDVDASTVEGSGHPEGTHPLGFLWKVTTQGDMLLPDPISEDLHRLLVLRYWQPFHDSVKSQYQKFFSIGFKKVYQLDAHSMPSKGTGKHRDPGELRAEIVISDQKGNSCESAYRDLVVTAYETAGFQVRLNWPYLGGRVTQTYGHPEKGQHCIQVEMNRALYMNEDTKQLIPEKAQVVQEQVFQAVSEIEKGILSL